MSTPPSRGDDPTRSRVAWYRFVSLIFGDGSWEGDKRIVDRIFEGREAIRGRLAFWINAINEAKLQPEKQVEFLIDLSKTVDQKSDFSYVNDIKWAHNDPTLDVTKWLALYEKILSERLKIYEDNIRRKVSSR